MKSTRIVTLAIALALVVPAALLADPPSVVGRLNLVMGDVSFRPGSMDDWAPAVVNYPFTAGDDVWVDDDGRAEIHVGSTALRLGSASSLSFLNLDDSGLQVSLSQGSLNVSVYRALEGDDVIEIDTPNAVYTLIRPGSYRIDVRADDTTDVVVRSGAVVVTTAGENFAVNTGQTGNVSGRESVAYYVEQVIRNDGWDVWCNGREARERRSASARYVSREMIGVEDLDESGSWVVVAGYGTVWTPSNVPLGWAPYRYGHWAWVSPWGWTWIDDAAWGFAPFHYGRWAYAGNRWVWVPGAVEARPVYAPALVVFIGGDGDSVETVTWFPLAPREVYVPTYTVSVDYVRRINIVHVASAQDINGFNARQFAYANRRAPQAVTMVPRGAFVGAAPVSRSVVSVTGRDLDREPVVGMGVSVAPQRQSVYGRSEQSATPVRQPPASVSGRSVYTQRTPAEAPQPFVPGRATQTDTPQAPQRNTGTSSATTAGRSGLTVLTPGSRGRSQDDQPQSTPAGRTQNASTGRTTTAQDDQPQTTSPGRTTTAPTDRGNGKANATGPSSQADSSQARTLINTLKTSKLPQVESKLTAARSNKNLNYSSLSQQLATARSTLAAAESDLQAGKTDSALQKAQTVQSQLAQIDQAIDDATKSAGGSSTSPGRSGQSGSTPSRTSGGRKP